MALIDSENIINDETSFTTWSDELKNTKILLNEVDKGINTLIKSGHSSYDLNSGQGSQSVRRLSLLELRELRESLLYQISEIESLVGDRKNIIQILPGF